jgi:hypothetical protein
MQSFGTFCQEPPAGMGVPQQRFGSARLKGVVLTRDFRVLNIVKPDVAVNCIGVIKQRTNVNDPVVTIALSLSCRTSWQERYRLGWKSHSH